MSAPLSRRVSLRAKQSNLVWAVRKTDRDCFVAALLAMTNFYDSSFCRRSAIASGVLSGVKVAVKRPCGSIT